MSAQAKDQDPEVERRRYERISSSSLAKISVTEMGQRVGKLRQLGGGGIRIESDKLFDQNGHFELEIVDASEKIHAAVKVTCRYSQRPFSGFEFQSLDMDTAEVIGTLLGKYYPDKG